MAVPTVRTVNNKYVVPRAELGTRKVKGFLAGGKKGFANAAEGGLHTDLPGLSTPAAVGRL